MTITEGVYARTYDATRRMICSATWCMFQQFALQQVSTLKDVLPIFLSDENTPKTRIFCKMRTFYIQLCYLLKLFYTF